RGWRRPPPARTRRRRRRPSSPRPRSAAAGRKARAGAARPAPPPAWGSRPAGGTASTGRTGWSLGALELHPRPGREVLQVPERVAQEQHRLIDARDDDIVDVVAAAEHGRRAEGVGLAWAEDEAPRHRFVGERLHQPERIFALHLRLELLPARRSDGEAP